MSFAKIFFLFFVFITTEILAADANTIAQFSPNTEKLNLTPYIEILADPEHRLSINDISEANKHFDFKPASEIGNSFGFSKSVYWVRFALNIDKSYQDSLLLELEYPLIDHVTFFTPDGQGGFNESVTGDALPFSHREAKHRTFIFHIPQKGGQTHYYYLRLYTEGSMQIPLSLWECDAFIEYINTSYFIFGGYYAIMLLLFLAALIAFIKIRDNLFLFYALYLLSYFLFQFSLNGFSYQYLWPDQSWFTSRATSAFVGLVVICGILFSGSFLQIWGKNHHPRVKILFYALSSIGFLGLFLSLFGDYPVAIKISTISGVLLPPIIFIAILSALSIGYRPARYFLGAWSIFLVGVFVSGLLHLGFISHNFFTVYVMQIGSTLEILLLGYALLDRIDLLRIEKEQAQEEANEYLIQLNEELEILVAERTITLEETNKELSELAIHDSMTGMLNHNASIDYLKLMHQTAKRYHNDLSVIMLDIDLFKSINDQYGHPAGDRVIISIAEILNKTIRESDGCGRYGGEEFILILPETDINKAYELAERVRKTIMQLKISEIDLTPVTASFGISVLTPENPDADLVDEADIALYEAKRSGRNKVILSKLQH